MASLTPGQRRTRERVETLISLAAPALNLVLSVGERISRVAEPEDSEYYPLRSGLTEGEAAGERRRPPSTGAPAGD